MTNVLKIVPTETKNCFSCKVAKPYSEFYRNKNKPDGYAPSCKVCSEEGSVWKENYVRPTHKICTKCKVEKPLNQFTKNNVRKTTLGVTPDCKVCRYGRYKDPRKGTREGRPDRVFAKYGVTYEEVKIAYANQFGLCANHGCAREIILEGRVGNKKAVIDHCHTTGKFRALLCSGCNMLLGKIENEKNIVLGLMEYLNKYKFK